MIVVKTKETEKTVNPLDGMMTRAQVARRKFKSTLPRKIENRRLSALEAIGETFKLFIRFREILTEQGVDPDITLNAGLAYCLPESDPAMLGTAVLIPGPSNVGAFCDGITKLDRPLFLGMVFIQLDPDTDDRKYKWASFCTQFMGGPEAESRLQYAQKMCLAQIANTAKKMGR